MLTLRIAANTLMREAANRWNSVLGFAMRCLTLLVTIAVWKAIFAVGNGAPIKGYTFDAMATYLVVVALSRTPFAMNHINLVSSQIVSGALMQLLLRPVSYFRYHAVWFMTQRLANILPMTIFCLLLALTFGFRLELRASPTAALLVASNLVLLYVFGMALGNLGFWLVATWPITAFAGACMTLVGGLAFPLDLLPERLYAAALATPFPYFGYVNIKALQGSFSDAEATALLARSAAYTLASAALYALSWRHGLRRFTAMGG